MKKHIFETKKTKLLAFVLLLCALIFMFSSCGYIDFTDIFNSKDNYIRYQTNANINFYSHEQLLNFVEQYNSQNDGFVYTFISFDFDDNSIVQPYLYTFRTIAVFEKNEETGEHKRLDLYDKDHSNGFGFGCEYTLHMDDYSSSGEKIERAYQICCAFSTNKAYNFHQEDEFVIDFVGCYNIEDNYKNFAELRDLYPNDETFIRQFADAKSMNVENYSYDRYYEYIYIFRININGKDEISIQITSESEMTQEKLDKICKLLLDNIVIINMEG